jgi:hypothetical protein
MRGCREFGEASSFFATIVIDRRQREVVEPEPNFWPKILNSANSRSSPGSTDLYAAKILHFFGTKKVHRECLPEEDPRFEGDPKPGDCVTSKGADSGDGNIRNCFSKKRWSKGEFWPKNA